MKFNQLCSYLQYLYTSGDFSKVDADNSSQFSHQPTVIARAWQGLVERKQTGVILADEVGLGKTFEALGVMYFYLLDLLSREKREDLRVLIVLPPKLITKWENEIERFAEQIQGIENIFTAKERAAGKSILHYLSDAREVSVKSRSNFLLAGDRPLRLNSHGVFLIRTTTLTDLMGYSKKGAPASAKNSFNKLPWDIILIDEAHNYARGETGQGNQRSKTIQTLSKNIKNGKIVLCTATPFQLDTIELVNLINLVEPNIKLTNAISKAIEKYNEQIIFLRNALVHDKTSLEITVLRKELMDRKSKLENLLRPYLLRSQRPENDGREQRKFIPHSIEPGADFSWLYWTVREWARKLSTSGEKHIQTFLPTTLQITLSSAGALHDHLENFRRNHGPVKQADVVRKSLLRTVSNKGFVHPKHEALNVFINNRIDEASKNFDGKLEQLAAYKSVIFVSHKSTIQELTKKKDGVLDQVEKLSDALQIRNMQILDQKKFKLKEFRKEVRAAVGVCIKKILQEYNFTVADKPDIWETPYQAQVDSEYVHLRRIQRGIADDLSEILASNLVNTASISQVLRQNLYRKLQEPLSEYELLSYLVATPTNNNGAWKVTLAKVVGDKIDQRLKKPLQTIKKLYYGSDYLPDQPREKLRLRLSQLAYSFSPRKPIEALYGEVDFATRQQIIDSFNNDLYPLILICSSVAEEGIDLQKRCNTVVHYDLEWNPAKVEQREGRVDRLGRTSKDQVQIRTFKLSKTYDERILARCENRKIWMDLYLCKTWQEEGRKLEEETILKAPEQALLNNPDWLVNYRLDLRPAQLPSIER